MQAKLSSNVAMYVQVYIYLMKCLEINVKQTNKENKDYNYTHSFASLLKKQQYH